MSSRYPPGRGDSRYASRDRSPPRYLDRRPSGHQTGPSPSARNHNDLSYRANDVHSHSGPGREPPRGPKAFLGGPRGGGYIPRGRGFGRGETREREFRDQRDNSVGRRGRDQRDWGRRGRDLSRERRPSPTGRNRSRSPGPPREFRDNRDFPPREIDVDTSRRASREGYGQPSPAISDTSHSAGPGSRGGYFGRGRADREYGRGSRGSFGEEREPYRARSRSRERMWERRPHEERDYDRNPNQVPLRDDREREIIRREGFAHCPDVASSVAIQDNYPSTHTVFRPGANHSSYDARSSVVELSARMPTNSVASSVSSGARDAERLDSNGGAFEREPFAHRASSPPQAPQVPAFGSIVYQAPKAQQEPAVACLERNEASTEPTTKPLQLSPHIPSGPKADFATNLPTGPKADQSLGKRSQVPATGDNGADGHDKLATSSSRPFDFESRTTRLSGSERFSDTSKELRQGQESPKTPFNRSPNFAPRSSSFNAVTPNRPNFGEHSGQPSPLKIPTGPRAERNLPAARPPLQAPARTVAPRPTMIPRGPPNRNLSWIRPGLSQHVPQQAPQHFPRGPSMMGSMITKKFDSEDENSGAPDSEGDNSDMEGLPVRHPEAPTSNQLSQPINSMTQRHDEPSQASSHDQIRARDLAKKDNEKDEPSEQAVSPKSPIKPMEANNVDKPVLEDEHMDVDEEYLADERKFEQNLRVIESRRPATPRRNVQLLSLLDEIDAFASAAEDRASGRHEIPVLDTDVEKPPTTLTPVISRETNGFVQKPTTHQQIVRILTPSLESLPYLMSGPSTPFSELEDPQEIIVLQHIIDAQVVEELISRIQLEDVEESEIKDQFAQDLKSWRLQVEAMEDQKRAQNGLLSVPDTPSIPVAQALPTVEGRRPGRNLSQLDMERILQESKLSADEEEQRRQREAQNTGHKAKEASIPPMLTQSEAHELRFADTTNKLDSKDAFTLLGYQPKVDDFSPEEHQLFIEAFLAEPKRFGAIARRIPNRTYQECIQHYYLTKQDGQYKERFSSKAKRGRGKGVGLRGSSGRPKAAPSSLLSNSFGDDPAVVAVTESGRPRRNAAPTFGICLDGEPLIQATTPARRNVSGNKAEALGDTPEKPSGKRSRTGPAKEKGVRKSKAPLLAAAPGPSPPKIEKENTRGKSKEPKLENEQQVEEMKTAELLANLSNTQIGPVPGLQVGSEIWSASQPIAVSASSSIQKPQYSVQEQFQAQTKGGPPTSSYWSVPEQTDFNNLIHVFGTNWQAIADHMKTKTQTMVKNYYHRQVERGESKLMEQAAQAADEKIKRGEDMGVPPPPTIVPKRRYDTGPQPIPQRQLAPSVETSEVEKESPALLPTKPAPLSPPQFAQSSQRFGTILQPEPVGKASVSQPVAQAPSTPAVRSTTQTLQQRSSQILQGPRAGFFSNDHARPILQPQPQQQPASAPAPHQQQQQPRQHTQQDLRQPRQFVEQPTTQDGQEVIQTQHRPRHQESQQMPSRYQQSLQSQQSALSMAQVMQARQPSQGSQVRIAPSQAMDVDIRPRVASQQQLQSQQMPRSDPHHPENSSGMRRLDSHGAARQTPLQSLAQSRVPQTFSPPQEALRPSSVPAAATQQPPKKSNIMNLLNDEPAEPQSRKRISDARPAAPTPPPQSPAGQMYQQTIQPTQQFSRRELANETSHVVQQQHMQRPSLGQILSQQPGPGQHRDALPTNWAEVAQRNFNERQQPNYQKQLAESPRMQPSFTQASRPPLQPLQRTHAPTPPPIFAHSRASSYASLHSQQQPPQTIQQTQQPSQSSAQATPVLQPSPYAQIHPHIQPHQQHPHSHSSQQQQYPAQHLHVLQQQQQQHRDPEPMTAHQQQFIRQQEAMQQQRRQDPFRQVQPDQSRQQEMQQYQSILRPQRDLREANAVMEGIGRREDAAKETARREEILRREEAMRREDMAARRTNHTPPGYSHNGGFQQPRDRQPRGYDERERR